MKEPNKKFVEMEKRIKRLTPDMRKKPIDKEPAKHVSVKPGHIQARDCSAEDWFK